MIKEKDCYYILYFLFLKKNFGLCYLSVYVWNSEIICLLERRPLELVAQRCSVRKDVLRNFTKLTGKHLCQSLSFNKVAGLRPQACNFIKRETLAQVFSFKFREISKNTFFKEHLLWLLLVLEISNKRLFTTNVSIKSISTQSNNRKTKMTIINEMVPLNSPSIIVSYKI